MPDPVVPDPVVALVALLNSVGAIEIINRKLAKLILPNAVRHLGDRGKLRSQYDRLCNMEACTALALVWRQSRCITDVQLACAGIKRPRGERGITRHALGLALKASAQRPKDYDTEHKFLRRAERIVEAAITFGLIEPEGEEEGNGCFKALQGTPRLHDLMVEIGDEIDLIFSR